jgi:hypothetical protein
MFPANAAVAIEPHLSGQVFDLMYGAKSWGLGVRLHLFSDSSFQQGLIADVPETTATFTTDINAGFALGKGFDMRTNLSFRHANDFGELLIGRVGMRYLDPREKKVRMVLAAELEFGFFLPDDDNIDSSFGVALPVKAGVLMAVIPDSMYLGLLAGLDIQMLSIQDQDMRFGVSIPTLEMGLEYHALSWLHLRSAIKGAFGIQLAGDPGDHRPQYEQMTFSSGAGLLLGPITIDGVIQYRLWQNGPYLLSGVPGIFAGVTVAFTWGGAPEASSYKPMEESKPAPVVTKPVPAETKPAPKAEEKPAAKPAADKTTEKKEGGDFEGWGD